MKGAIPKCIWTGAMTHSGARSKAPRADADQLRSELDRLKAASAEVMADADAALVQASIAENTLAAVSARMSVLVSERDTALDVADFEADCRREAEAAADRAM